MLKRFIVGVLLLTPLGIMPAIAQDTSGEWEVLLLTQPSGELLSISPLGITERLAIPGYANFRQISNPVIAPNRQYLAFVGTQTNAEGEIQKNGFIANLGTNTCCQSVPPLTPTPPNLIVMGPYNPDSSQIAVLVASTLVPNEGGAAPSGVLALLNTADTSVATILPMSALHLESFTDYQFNFGEWNESGISLSLRCVACGDGSLTQNFLWDVVANTLNPSEDVSYPRTLARTGEALRIRRDDTRPTAEDTRLANVVEYHAADTTRIIYTNPNIIGVEWVMDGQAVLVLVAGNQAVLVFRNGSQAPITFEGASSNTFARVLAGTRDGWLMFNAGMLQHYRVENATLTITPLGSVEGILLVVDTPDLGASASGQFPSVE